MLTPPAPWLNAWPRTFPCSRGPWTVTNCTDWAIVDPEGGTVEIVNPADDPKLIGLPAALERAQLVSYRHRRRAVLESELGYTKVSRPKRSGAIADRHRLFAELGLEGPKVQAQSDDGRLDLERVPGQSLHYLLNRGQVNDDHLWAIAKAIGELHNQKPSEAPIHDRSTNWIETTRRGDAELASLLERHYCELPPVPDAAESLIHTDLHDKNILLGASAKLIDLDGLALGNPAHDLGNLLAHFTLRMLQTGRPLQLGRELGQALLDHYRKVASVDEEAVHIAQRHTFLRLAALYNFRLESRPLVPDLLRLAVHQIA